MSSRPGRIERAIRALFDANPGEAFVTDELAEHCYPGAPPVLRKHRIGVLKATRAKAEQSTAGRKSLILRSQSTVAGLRAEIAASKVTNAS